MKLYNYFRSSASYRVRIALQLKGLAYDYVPVHLVKGEQKAAGFGAVSAEHLVPVLELDDGRRLSQSMAIIEYLDEAHPQPALLPADAPGAPGCGRWRRSLPARSTRSTTCACSSTWCAS
jgi:maleylacetoacetate isomerase/maleylpyruvate isomerase